MKYLSEERIKLGKKFPGANEIDLTKDLEDIGWQDCPWSKGQKIDDGKQFRFYNPFLSIDEKSFCEIRKINSGYLKGHYCLIEFVNGAYSMSVNGDGGVLKFPEIRGGSIEQIDQQLSAESILDVAINKLMVYDIRASRQPYRTFVDYLPKECFADRRFVNAILREIDENRDKVDFVGVADREDINVDHCVAKTINYIVDLRKQKDVCANVGTKKEQRSK